MLKSLLSVDRNPLNSEHIKQAMSLPPGHSARQLVVHACFSPYIAHIKQVNRNNKSQETEFKFMSCLADIDGFAVEFFKAYNEALRNKIGAGAGYTIDPFTGEVLFL